MTRAKKGDIPCLVLTQKAEVKEAKLAGATLADIKAYLKKKDAPEILGTYKQKALTLFLFGHTKGKAGTENKHELPPPHDSLLAFGDIVLLASKDPKSYEQPTPFKVEDYESFYTRAFGGFEDLDEGGEEEEEEEPVVEEEAEEVEEGKEFDEEDEEEEEEDEEAEEDEGAEEGAEEVGGEEEDIVVAPKAKKVARKKATKANQDIFSSANLGSYLSHVDVTPDQILQTEKESPKGGVVAQRGAVQRALTKLFQKKLTAAQILGLERAIYNGALQEADRRHITRVWTYQPFVDLYQMHARHIAANFLPDSYVGNTELFDRFKKGEVAFTDLSSMDTYQLFASRWKDSFERQQIQEKSQLEGNKAMATDQFLCSRCWKRECTYYEMQTRSADEPMTIFITCLNCGKHWRQ
jgi:DNA-directed RNA polymerase subunit M/transcription elongation factor TFIIS